MNEKFVTFGATKPGGSSTQLQYNNAGFFAGTNNLTWDSTFDQLSLTGILTVDNLRLDGNTLSSTSTILISPNSTLTLKGLVWPSADGNANEFLQTDGAGNLSFAPLSTAGSSGDVQYNDGSNGHGAEAAFNYNSATNTLSVDNVSATTLAGTLSGSSVSLADAGGYYTTDNAEAALQQLGYLFATVPGSFDANAVLFTDGSGNLDTESTLTYNSSTNNMVLGDGKLLIGDTATISTPGVPLHIISSSLSSSSGGGSPQIWLENTETELTEVFSNNIIASIDVKGGEAGGRGIVGQILWKASSTWTATSSNTDLFLSTAKSGTLTIDPSTTFVLKSAGGMGWGTDNPRSKLHILDNRDALADLDNMNRYTFGLSTESDSNGTNVSIGFSVDATFTTVGGAIVYERTGDTGKGRMHFYTKQNTSAGNPSEALRLEDDGTVIAYGATTVQGNLTVGAGAAGVDYTFTIDGETNDFVATWMEDEDYLSIADDILGTQITMGGTASFSSTVRGSTLNTLYAAHSAAGTTEAEVMIHRHSTSATVMSLFYGMRSRGSHGSETIVNDDDSLFSLVAAGHDGTDYDDSARIDFQVDGTPGANQIPGRMIFKTASSAGVMGEVVRFDSAQEATFVDEVFLYSNVNPVKFALAFT